MDVCKHSDNLNVLQKIHCDIVKSCIYEVLALVIHCSVMFGLTLYTI